MMKKQLITALMSAVVSLSALAAGPQRAAGPQTPRQARFAPHFEATATASTTGKPLTRPTLANRTTTYGQSLHDAVSRPSFKAPVMRVLGDGTTIYGSLIYSDTWAGTRGAFGLYSFPASSNPEATFVKDFESYEANGGGTYGDGKYYFNSYVYTDEMGYTFSTFFTYDLATGEYTKTIHSFINEGFDQSQITHDMAYDATTGTIYAVSYILVNLDDEGLIQKYRPAISTVDPTFGMVTPLAQTPEFAAIACNRAGELYGISAGTGSTLYRINKSTGDCTAIGLTGLTPQYVQSAAFDPVTDKLYWAAVEYTGRTGLYEVDVHTGAASKIAAFPHNEEYSGIYIPEPAIEAGAPAIASDLAANFVNDALEGTFSLTAPTLTQGGAQLSGTITMEMSLDGEDFATLDVQPGQKVSVPSGALTEGLHNFGVYFANTTGNGPRTAMSFYAGMDAPDAVTDLKVEADADARPHISWTAPTTGRNDGYIDPAQITYTIVRMPEGLTLAEGIKTTDFTDRTSFDAQNVVYTVTPYIGNREGLPASTAEALFGSGSQLPVTFGFDTEDDFNLCTIIDANEDYDAQYHWGGWMYGPNFSYTGVDDPCVIYGYHPDYAADDWVIMPPFTAENGKKYRVTFEMWTKGDQEMLEVTAGPQATVAAQKTILPSKGYNHKDRMTFTAEFDATAAGNYYVGFHCTSAKKKFYLYIDNVTIDEVPLTGAPGAVTSFSVTPGAKGALEATLSLTAPSVTAEGAALSSLERIDIFRGNDRTAIHSFAAPAAGASLSWTDTQASQGINEYRAVAYNAIGAGEKALASTYVGHDIPLGVTDAVLVEENGFPVVKWTAPAGGVNGGYVDVENLTYLIRRSDGSLMTNKATGTSFRDETLNPMEHQYFIYYQIEPVSPAGIGDYALTNHIIFGEPYEGEFYESFADAALSTDPWVMYNLKGRNQLWTIVSAGSTPACYPADNDGGLLAFESSNGYVNDEGRICSPKLSLADFNLPVLTFYVYNNPSTESIYGEDPYLDRVIPELGLPDGSYVAIDEPIYIDDPTADYGWWGYQYDLSAYKDYEYVQICFHGISDSTNDVYVDAISLTNEVEYDLGIYTFSAPGSVKAGKDVKLKTTIANMGMMPAEGFRINIYRNGEDFTYITSTKAVPAQSYATYSISVPTTLEDEGKTISWTAEIVWDKDAIANNNKSTAVITKVVAPDVPEVNELVAANTEGGIALSWNGLNALRVNDDFESHSAFAIEDFGDYTLIDGDGGYTYTFNDIYYENAGNPIAFQIFNPYSIGVAQYLPEWGAHSGYQVLAAFCAVDATGSDIAADDWLISPAIHGATKVGFWAKTANWEWGLEKFDVMYSTTTAEPESFKSFEGVITAPAEWTHYEFELPLNAKYFAIHNVSNETFILYIDDLTFTARLENEGYEHTGYRIYRNGTAIADVENDAANYLDATKLADGHYTYGIRALYKGGRESASAAEAEIHVGTSGIDAAEAAAGVSVSAEGNVIVITCAEGSEIAVVNAAGITLFAEESSAADTRVAVASAGVYLVNVNGKSFKIRL